MRRIGDYRASFIAMAVTIAIDSSDGTLARYFNVKTRVPGFDGALLDNIVDYLTYVVAPVFLVIRAGVGDAAPSALQSRVSC